MRLPVPRRKKAYELTTDQALRRLFPKEVRKAMKRALEHVDGKSSPRKPQKRKAMKGW